MAKLEGGIFGAFRGKIGNTVYYQRKGVTVARKIGKINKPSSLKQKTCRQGLKVLSQFFKPVKTLINAGFKRETLGTQMNAYSAAVKFNMGRATEGEYPNVGLVYDQILLSKGPLFSPLAPSVEKEPDGIRFRWETTDLDYQNHSDNAMILVYFPDSREAICLLNAAQRKEGTALVQVNREQLNLEAHCYMAFIAVAGVLVSDSVYVGKI